MKLIFILFFLVLSLISNAQTGFLEIKKEVSKKSIDKVSLSGTITDAKSNEPLPGSSIYLANERIGTAADANGNYVLNDIPNGHHVIEISHAGYSTLVVHIEISATTEKDFALSPVVVENLGVIVTGVAGATSIRKSPVPVVSIRKLTLLQTPSTNIIDALSHIPGVSQLSTGPAISKPYIRGLGGNRVVIVNEGVRQEGQQWGDEHGAEIDEMSVVRAEVVKGPASLMYGSDALAGVINFITNLPVAEGSLKGNLITNYQSNNGLFAINGSLAGNKNGLNWNVYGTYKSAGNYKNKYDGKVLNSGFDEKNIGGYIGINKSWGYSHIILSRFDQQLGLIEGERDNTSGDFLLFAGSPLERIASKADLDSRKLFVPKQRVQHNKIISDNNFAFNKSRLKINLAYQQNLRQEFGDPVFPDEKDLFFDLKTFNYNIQWQLPELKEWHTTIGVNGMQQSNQNKGIEALIPEYDLFDFGAFVFGQRIYKKATISGGIRFDKRTIDSKEMKEGADIKFPAFQRSYGNFSGSIGVSYEASEKLTFKANIARGFRSPTLAELASNGAHEGTNRYEFGTQDLKSETSLQLDAGMNFNYEHFSIDISAFYNRMNDFIFYRKLASIFGGDSLVNNGGDFIPAFKFNQQDAKLAGFEATIDIHPHPLDWLHIENSFSFVRGKFDALIDGSNNIPLIPAAKLTNELKADFKKLGKNFKNFYARLELENTFDQNNPFTGFETETATKGYSLLNAGFGADVVDVNKILFSVHVGVTNITDVASQSHLSRLKYTSENMLTGRTGVFNTGRNFSIKINVPLVFTMK